LSQLFMGFADLDGDGFGEIVRTLGVSSGLRGVGFRERTPELEGAFGAYKTLLTTDSTFVQMTTIDLDNDGVEEALVFGDTAQNHSLKPAAWSWKGLRNGAVPRARQTNIPGDRQFLRADLNGDGLVDILTLEGDLRQV